MEEVDDPIPRDIQGITIPKKKGKTWK